MGATETRRGRRAADRAVPLARALAALVVVVLVVVLAAGLLLGRTVAELRAAQDDAQDRLLPAVAQAQGLLTLFVNQETGERGYLLTGDPAFLDPYARATADLPGALDGLRQRVRDLPGASAALDRISSEHGAWLADAVVPELGAVRAGDLAAARSAVATGSGRTRFDALRAATADLQVLLARQQAASNAHIRSLTTRLAWLLAAALGVLALLGLALYPALRRLVVQPLQRLARAARSAGGDLGVPVVLSGPREVVEAARDVEGMRRRLVEQVSAARTAEQALEQRGPAVVALREALAPDPVEVPGIELVSRLDAAEGVLAGDWFDAIALPGGRVALVLGDVAGHGPGPAVFALRLKHLLAAALAAGREPGEALTATARQIGETGELFATLVVLVVDVAADVVVYANAGHPAPLLVRRPEPEAPGEPRRDVLEATGPMLSSLTASWSWLTMPVPFCPGDLLLAYTDGLVEARDATGEQYGSDRLVAALHADLRREVTGERRADLTALVGRLVDDVARFGQGRAADDITVMACRRT